MLFTPCPPPYPHVSCVFAACTINSYSNENVYLHLMSFSLSHLDQGVYWSLGVLPHDIRYYILLFWGCIENWVSPPSHVMFICIPSRFVGPRKIHIEVSYQRAQNSGVAKWQFSGIWMRHLCQKCQFGGCTVPLGPQFPLRQKFKILGLGDQYSGVWYYTFRLRRPQIRGFASYIWAPKSEFSGAMVWGLGAYIPGSSICTHLISPVQSYPILRF